MPHCLKHCLNLTFLIAIKHRTHQEKPYQLPTRLTVNYTTTGLQLTRRDECVTNLSFLGNNPNQTTQHTPGSRHTHFDQVLLRVCAFAASPLCSAEWI